MSMCVKLGITKLVIMRFAPPRAFENTRRTHVLLVVEPVHVRGRHHLRHIQLVGWLAGEDDAAWWEGAVSASRPPPTTAAAAHYPRAPTFA